MLAHSIPFCFIFLVVFEWSQVVRSRLGRSSFLYRWVAAKALDVKKSRYTNVTASILVILLIIPVVYEYRCFQGVWGVSIGALQSWESYALRYCRSWSCIVSNLASCSRCATQDCFYKADRYIFDFSSSQKSLAEKGGPCTVSFMTLKNKLASTFITTNWTSWFWGGMLATLMFCGAS